MKVKSLFLTTAFLCAGVLAQSQMKLSFNPAKGEKYVYRFSTEQSIKQTIMDREIPTNTIMEILTEMNIKEKNKDEISVDYLYREIVMEFSNSMMNVKYDSKKSVADLSELEKYMAQILNPLIGKSMNVVFKSDGSVESVFGFQAIVEEILKNLNVDNQTMQQMSTLLLQSFNDDAVKRTFEQSFKIYPDKEVKVGDDWGKDVSLVLAGLSSDIKNRYMLKSVENDIALLEMVAVSDSKPNIPNVEGEIAGSERGEISLNVKTGMTIHSTSTGNMKGTFNMQGVDVLMEIEMKGTVSLQR